MALPKGTQFSMAPTGASLSIPEIPGLIAAQIVDAGFGGLHVPFEPVHRFGKWNTNLPAIVELARRADDEGWHLLGWLYGNAHWGTAPERGEFRTDAARAYEDEVAEALAPFKAWTLGLQFDGQEDRTHNEIERWTHRMRTGPAVAIMSTCRPQKRR